MAHIVENIENIPYVVDHSCFCIIQVSGYCSYRTSHFKSLDYRPNKRTRFKAKIDKFR